MLYYLKWLLAATFGYVIPWWLWGLIGLAASILVFLFVPALVPERMRLALSGLVLMLGAILSAGSWGIDHGISLERQRWANIISKEMLRLKMDAEANLKAEQQRTASAELHSKILQGQLDAIDDEAERSIGTCDKPVVPEPTARKLHNLTGRRR